MKSTAFQHIEVTPGICGGRARIAGHRVRVQDIVVCHEHLGQSPDEIVARFPELTLADVHAALTYYFDHRDEIRQQINEDRKLADDLQATIPSKLPEKRTAEDSGSDSVSP